MEDCEFPILPISDLSRFFLPVFFSFGLTAGSGYDQLAAAGPLYLAGSLNLNFGAFVPTGHDILFLINDTGNAADIGSFQYADDARIGTFNGFNWFITYDANNVASPSLNGGNDVAIYSAPVPEPSTLILFGVGAIGILGCAWQRRRREL